MFLNLSLTAALRAANFGSGSASAFRVIPSVVVANSRRTLSTTTTTSSTQQVRRTFMEQQQQRGPNRRGFSSSSSAAAATTATTTSDSGDDNNNHSIMTPEALMEAFLAEYYSSSSSSSSNNNNPPPPPNNFTMVGNAVMDAMYALYNADAVAFDVDSTVIAEEGIDVLAEYLGMGEQVATLTRNAMEGHTKFEDALQARLDLLRPSKTQIVQLLQEQPLQLTNGIVPLIQALQHAKIDIWLVSGGFRIMIEPIASMLNIPSSNIVANTILFNNDTVGSYTDFDRNEPTSRDMGKPKAIQQIIDRSNGTYKTVVMVGDGATDAQAKPPAKAFIGFGGVIQREAVKAKADWFVTNFDAMTKIVQMRGDDRSGAGTKVGE